MTILKYGDKGPDVRRLQKLLNENAYRKPRRKLEVDGVFGPLTAAAVQGSKFWMGYSKLQMEPVAGEQFMDLITGKVELPPDHAQRRQERLSRVAEHQGRVTLRVRALGAAKADVGLVEGPGNAIKYNTWWCAPKGNDGGAYCVRAGSYWYEKAGSAAVLRGSRWQNTDAMLLDARSGNHGLHLTDEPEAGCGFVIDFSGHSDPDHFGLYVKDLGRGTFQSLEANAVLASGRQGVGYHVREYRNCWFIEFEE